MTTPSRAPYFHFDEKVNDKRRKAPAKEGGPGEDNVSETLTRPSSSSSAGSSTPTLKKLPLDKVFYETPVNNKHTPRRISSGDGSGPVSNRHTPRRPGDGPNSGQKGSWKANPVRSSNDGFVGQDYLQVDARHSPPPPLDALWEYMDSKGDVHGPYAADKILLWYDSKRFPGFDDSLILRLPGHGSWSSMKSVLHHLRWQVQSASTPPPPTSNSFVIQSRGVASNFGSQPPRVRFAEDPGNESDGEDFSDLPPHIAQRLKGANPDSFADLPPHLAARLNAKASGQLGVDNSPLYEDDDDGPPPGITTSRGSASIASRVLSPDSDLASGPPPRRRAVRPAPQQPSRNMDYRMLSDRELTMVAESLFLGEPGGKWYYMDPNNPRTSEPMAPQQMMDIITLRGLDPNFLIVGVSSAVTMPPSPAFYRPLGGLMHNSLRGEKYRVVTKADMMMDAPGLSWNVVRNVSDSGGVESAVHDNGYRHDRHRNTDESESAPIRKDRRKAEKQVGDSWTGSPTHSSVSAGPAVSDRSSSASFAQNNTTWASPSTNVSTGGKQVSRTQPKGSPFAGTSDAPTSTKSESPEPGVALDMDDILDAHITGQLSASLSAARLPSGLVAQSSSAGVEAMESGTGKPSSSVRPGYLRDPKAKLAMGGLQSWASQVSDELGRGMSMEASSSLTRDNSLAIPKTTSTATTDTAQAQSTPETMKPLPFILPDAEPQSIERGTSPMRPVPIEPRPVTQLTSRFEPKAAANGDKPALEPPVISKSPVKLPDRAASTAPATPLDDEPSTSAPERRISSAGSQASSANGDALDTGAASETAAAKPGLPSVRSSVGSLDCKPPSMKLSDSMSAALANKPVFKSLDLKETAKAGSGNSSAQNSPMSEAAKSGLSQAALARAAVASAMKSQSNSTPRPPVKDAAGTVERTQSSGRVSGLAAFFMQQMKQN